MLLERLNEVQWRWLVVAEMCPTADRDAAPSRLAGRRSCALRAGAREQLRSTNRSLDRRYGDSGTRRPSAYRKLERPG
jgi:hypothetical protein